MTTYDINCLVRKVEVWLIFGFCVVDIFSGGARF